MICIFINLLSYVCYNFYVFFNLCEASSDILILCDDLSVFIIIYYY